MLLLIIKLMNFSFGPCNFFFSIQAFLKLFVLVSAITISLLIAEVANGIPLHPSYAALINPMCKNSL